MPSSPAPGVYVGVNVVSFVKTPFAPTFAVQYTLVLFDAAAPPTVYALLTQTSPSPPALAVGIS